MLALARRPHGRLMEECCPWLSGFLDRSQERAIQGEEEWQIAAREVANASQSYTPQSFKITDISSFSMEPNLARGNAFKKIRPLQHKPCLSILQHPPIRHHSDEEGLTRLHLPIRQAQSPRMDALVGVNLGNDKEPGRSSRKQAECDHPLLAF
jgi:hypothetical protein